MHDLESELIKRELAYKSLRKEYDRVSTQWNADIDRLHKENEERRSACVIAKSINARVAAERDKLYAAQSELLGQLEETRNETIALKAECDAALRKAEVYQRDWIQAKHEFGIRIKEVVTERDELRKALGVENSDDG